MIVVVDYGVNNLKSVVRALAAGGHDATLSSDPDVVRRADRVVVPGVGHFRQARANLDRTGLGEAIVATATAGRPLIGICLGMQLLCAASEEAPDVPGLGLLPARIVRFATTLPVPHVGWARVEATSTGRQHPVSAVALPGGTDFFYHVHSFHPADVAEEAVLGTAEYDGRFATLLGRGNVVGAQFHPEKSQEAGIRLLAAFARWTP